MKFLIDENVPIQLLKELKSMGHDAVRVTLSSPDLEIAERSRKEERILVTLDKEFANRALYPPDRFSIIHIHIHPPYQDVIIKSFKKLLETVPADKFGGLIILDELFHVKIRE